MSKIDEKTRAKAIELGQKLGHEKIYVKISNGQMYSKLGTASYGLTKKEFDKNFETVEVPAKEEKKAPAKGAAPKKDNVNPDAGAGDKVGDEKEVLAALREEYNSLSETKVFNGWDAETVRSKIADLKAAKQNPQTEQ